MNPGAMGARDRQDLADRIERASVELSRLRDNNHWPRQPVHRARECLRHHAALRVGRHPDHSVVTQTEELQRGKDRGVSIITDHDMDRRRTEQAVGVRIPAGSFQHSAARGGEGDVVRRGRPGHESDRALRWQIQQIQQPPRRNRFRGRRRWAGEMIAGVLPPRGGQEIGGDTNRMRSANDPAEEPRPGHRAKPRSRGGDKIVDDGFGGLAGARGWCVEHRQRLGVAAWRPDGIGHRLAIRRRVVRRATEQRAERRVRQGHTTRTRYRETPWNVPRWTACSGTPCADRHSPSADNPWRTGSCPSRSNRAYRAGDRGFPAPPSAGWWTKYFAGYI